MVKPNLQMVAYLRDRTIKSADKFAQFERMLKEAKTNGADGVVIASPGVLGDTYDELVTNMNKLADANLLLAIVPASEQN